MNSEEEIKSLSALLDERTMRLMEREAELADKFEEIEAQKEELTAAVEQLITKNKHLLERNQELDQILYRSSHDLKSPLSSMFGLLSLMRSEKMSVDLKMAFAHFEQQMHQMNSVINTLTLLGNSVLDEIKLTEIELKTVVNEEVSQLQYLENFELIHFKKAFSGDEVVNTDNLLTRIIIRCLVANAIVFRERKPGIIEINVNANKDLVTLTVTDDGEGIDPAIESRMWDMFYRGSEKSKGQGMGLYLVKKIVERLNGTVRFFRLPGATVFEASIPLNPSPVA